MEESILLLKIGWLHVLDSLRPKIHINKMLPSKQSIQ